MHAARTHAQGLLVNDDKAAEHLNTAERQAAVAQQNGGAAAARGGGGFKWVAKWKHFRTTCVVSGTNLVANSPRTQNDGRSHANGQQQLIMLLIPNGMQSQVGTLSCKLVPTDASSTTQKSTSSTDSPSAVLSPKKEQSTLKGWFTVGGGGGSGGAASSKAPALGRKQDTVGKGRGSGGMASPSLFEPLALRAETLGALRAGVGGWETGGGGSKGWGGGGGEDAALEAALAASRAAIDGEGGGDAELSAALAASRAAGGRMEEERLMRQALAESERDARLGQEDEAALLVCGGAGNS